MIMRGNFKYISGNDLVAGVYNATPFLVDEDANVEKPWTWGSTFCV